MQYEEDVWDVTLSAVSADTTTTRAGHELSVLIEGCGTNSAHQRLRLLMDPCIVSKQIQHQYEEDVWDVTLSEYLLSDYHASWTRAVCADRVNTLLPVMYSSTIRGCGTNSRVTSQRLRASSWKSLYCFKATYSIQYEEDGTWWLGGGVWFVFWWWPRHISAPSLSSLSRAKGSSYYQPMFTWGEDLDVALYQPSLTHDSKSSPAARHDHPVQHRLSSATNRSRLLILLTESGKEFQILQAVTTVNGKRMRSYRTKSSDGLIQFGQRPLRVNTAFIPSLAETVSAKLPSLLTANLVIRNGLVLLPPPHSIIRWQTLVLIIRLC
ncbi:hypothetical protein J6590_018531 [Homalodisca vitripennis]|nr:hypothetical protein J6590_018531 [Homalodisca vitripennis]